MPNYVPLRPLSDQYCRDAACCVSRQAMACCVSRVRICWHGDAACCVSTDGRELSADAAQGGIKKAQHHCGEAVMLRKRIGRVTDSGDYLLGVGVEPVW